MKLSWFQNLAWNVCKKNVIFSWANYLISTFKWNKCVIKIIWDTIHFLLAVVFLMVTVAVVRFGIFQLLECTEWPTKGSMTAKLVQRRKKSCWLHVGRLIPSQICTWGCLVSYGMIRLGLSCWIQACGEF